MRAVAAAACAALSAGCGVGSRGAGEIAPAGPCSFESAEVAATRAPAEGGVRYGGSVSPNGEELCVVAAVPGAARRVVVRRKLAPYVVDLATQRAGAWQSLARSGEIETGCDPSVRCLVRYRFRVGAAARGLDDKDLALADHGVFLAPPSSWLLRFDGISPEARYRARVLASPPSKFVTGIAPSADEPGAMEGAMSGLGDTPYAAFGDLQVSSLPMPGGRVDVAITPGSTGVSSARLVAWVDQNAKAVAAYFGKLAAPRVLLIVRAGDSDTIGNGNTMGEGGASILLNVGRGTTERDLREDWVFVHEMVHVSFPNVRRPWAEEGLSTYVEPLVRVRAGLLDGDKVWSDLLDGLPKGQPESGDRGLDHTDTWGRRYWGGAIFWFLGDVEIRRRTGNAKSLDDALRAVVAAGGNVGVTWTLERTLEIADAAVGVPVLSELARDMKDAPVHADLAKVFADLGVRGVGDRVEYDDRAPLAAVRKAITARR